MSDQKNIDVFISHSEENSKLATRLSELIPSILGENLTSSFCSSRGREFVSSNNPHIDVVTAAKKAKICVLIADQKSYLRPWLLFEPGMFYVQDKKVLPVFCGKLTEKDLPRNFPITSKVFHAGDEDSLTNFIYAMAKNIVTLEKYNTKNYSDTLDQNMKAFIPEILKIHNEMYPYQESDMDMLRQEKFVLFRDD